MPPRLAAAGEEKIRILAELTRIRQICCDPSLLFEDYHGASAKREACIELIQSAMDGGHRMLIFSQFTSMLSLLEEGPAKRKALNTTRSLVAPPRKSAFHWCAHSMRARFRFS